MSAGTPLIRKLQNFSAISEEDCAWLASICTNAKSVAEQTHLIREGENPRRVNVIVEGFAARYKITSSGNRQFFGFLLPGDFCDMHVTILARMDHGIVTLTPCRVATITTAQIVQMTEDRPALTRAFWWCSLVDEAVLREWLVNIGQRQAEQRIAHLFCEIHVRMNAVGLAGDHSVDLPLTQAELADTMGLSVVHVNRTLKALRTDGLVSLIGDRLHIPDVPALKRYADFDPAYLHLTRSSEREFHA